MTANPKICPQLAQRAGVPVGCSDILGTCPMTPFARKCSSVRRLNLRAKIMMSKAALMYCCQGGSGAGHVQRALALAAELSEQFQVTMLLSDSTPKTIMSYSDVDLVFLRAPERRDTMLRIFDELRPRVVAIDKFPLEQYQLRDEFLPLIEQARNGHWGESLVVSITDAILDNPLTGNETCQDFAADILNRFFDSVIVRSDPVFARLEEFFRPKNYVHTPMYHTGFVTRRQKYSRLATKPDDGGIVVSTGHGPHGVMLCRSAIEAHRTLQQTLPIPMTVFAGTHLSEDEWQMMQSLAHGLPALSLKRESLHAGTDVASASWSVSDCAYDAATSAMMTGLPSLFVPSTDSNRRDQIERAKRLVYWGAGRLLLPRHLNSASLVNELHQLTKFKPRSMSFDLNGANNAAQLIAQIVYNGKYAAVRARPSSDTRLN